MKTLNKTLSLVLVLVMVLGLFGVAGAAFTDQNDVKYNEAVDVMTGIGAINGYTDGSIKPTGTITREEAAKLITYATLGADVAKNLKVGTNSFKDVAADRWSAPYIAYLVSKGIISGMGDGTFAPTANVTGYQFAKMMLCAAGYGAKGEFTGAGWELAVAVTANKAKVFASATDVDYSKAATREEAMLYAFNGITKVAQVEYNAVFGSYISNKGYGNAATTIATDTYGTKLVSRTVTDSFGRPATKWTYKGVEIGTYADDTTYTYTKNMNTTAGKKELTSTFKNFTIKDLNDTAAGTGNFIQKNGVAFGAELTAANFVAELAKATANGTVVEVYVDSVDNTMVIGVSALDVELAQVSKIDAVNKTVYVKTLAGATYKAESDNPYYEALKVMSVKDYILVSHLGTAVADLAKPTIVTGKLTNLGYDAATMVSVTVDGTAYPVSVNQDKIDELNSTSLSAKKDVTLYVDQNGYAVYITDVTATTPYVVVTKLSSSLVDGVIVKTAIGYAPDGTVVSLNIGDGSAASGNVAAGSIYSYAAADSTWATSHDAEYKLTIAPAQAGTTAVNGSIDVADAAIAVGNTMFSGTTATAADVPYTSDVKFIFVDSATGVTVKTGVQKVSTAANATALYVKNSSDVMVVPVVVVTNAPEDTTGESILYVAKKTGEGMVDGKPVFNYIAMIDGTPTPIAAKASATAGTFYTYAKDEKTNVYTLAVYGVAGVKTGVKNSTAVNDQFKDLTAGYILDTVKAADGTANLTAINAKNATVIDLTQTGVNTLADIADAKAAGKTVIMSVIYDNDTNSTTKNTVKYIYVVAVVTPTVAVPAGQSGTASTFVWSATDKAYVFTGNATNKTCTISLSGLPTGITATAAASGTTATATVAFADGVATVTGVAAGTTNITFTTAGGVIVVPVKAVGTFS